jgi:ABC-2 type transport system ATP-binding protein
MTATISAPTIASSPASSPSTPIAISFEDVELDFGEDAGVFDLSYSVPEGVILGLIGPSGCGKTTTVRLALGLYQARKGQIRVLGRDPQHFRTKDRERLGYIPQQFVLYPNLSVVENLMFAAALYGMTGRRVVRRIDELLDFVELRDARHRLGNQLSGGMQRRLMLAGALMHDPDLIFADEPTAGIDPVLRGRFWEYFRSLRDNGQTLLVTTQYVGEAAYCDYVAVMREGRILTVDTPEGLRQRVLGGSVIALAIEPGSEYEAIQQLRTHPLVRSARSVDIDEQGMIVIHAIVEDAGTALPELLSALSNTEGKSIAVSGANEYQMSYDDVFIRLMERAARQPIQAERQT